MDKVSVATIRGFRASLRSRVIGFINRIEYQCPSCLASNPFLDKVCHDCKRARPPISTYEVTVVILRAMVDAAYVAYILVTVGFLLAAFFITVRLMRPH